MAQAVTQDEALRRIRAALGDKYDLSKAVYVDSKTKITVICRKHGEFEKVPQLLWNGYGCNPCSRADKCIPLDEWVRRFREVHGNSYSYEKVIHPVAPNVRVTATCPDHGDFEKTPSMLCRGYGCNDCSESGISRDTWIERFREVHGDRYEYGEIITDGKARYIAATCHEHGAFRKQVNEHWTSGRGCKICDKTRWMDERRDGTAPASKNMMSQADAIRRFTNTHGETYEYTRVAYTGVSERVTITCKIHGDFQQLPHIHWNGSGCKKCTMKAVNKKTLSEVLSMYAEVHGDKYDYSLVTSYKGVEDEVRIICPSHGEFKQKARSHWVGYGCWDCSREEPSRLFTAEQVLEKFAEAHGDTYDYSMVEYEKCTVPIMISCSKHGVFSQIPAAHWRGQGCPSCATLISKPEREWASAIERHTGWNVERHVKIAGIKGRVDMCVEDTEFGKLAIEYDGCYWHHSEKSVKRDEHKTRQLTDMGYSVVRLREQGKHQLGNVAGAAINFSVTARPTDNQITSLFRSLSLNALRVAQKASRS